MCKSSKPSTELRTSEGLCSLVHAAIERDIDAVRKEYIFLPPLAIQWRLKRLIIDPRDLPNAYLLYNLLTTAAPAAVALFLLPPSQVFGVLYLVILYTQFIARFLVALLHVTSHRRLFKPGTRWHSLYISSAGVTDKEG